MVVNCYFYVTGTDLTVVVSRTLFADMLIALSLVPVYEAVRIQNSSVQMDVPARIRSGLKPVALYTILVALMTLVLFKMFADPLVAAKLNLLADQAAEAVANGHVTQDRANDVMETTERFYSIGFFLPIVLLLNLFVGFVSSILAAFLIKK